MIIYLSVLSPTNQKPRESGKWENHYCLGEAILDRYSSFKKFGPSEPPPNQPDGRYNWYKVTSDGPHITRVETGFFQDHAGSAIQSARSSVPAQTENRAKISASVSEPNRLEKIFGSADNLAATLDINDDGKVDQSELRQRAKTLTARKRLKQRHWPLRQ